MMSDRQVLKLHNIVCQEAWRVQNITPHPLQLVCADHPITE